MLNQLDLHARIAGAIIVLLLVVVWRTKLAASLLRGLSLLFHKSGIDFWKERYFILRPLEWGLVLFAGYLLFGAYLPPQHAQRLIRIVSITWLAWLCFSFIQFLHQTNVSKQLLGSSVSNTLFRLLHTILKGTILILAAMMIASEVGYDVKGVLAGLGIGGLAVALAAQDVLSQIFGCLTIVIDKPFAISDWIETPQLEGIVETISIRSTKIRTFQDALITMPNAKLANDQITNWSKMKRRRIQLFLRLHQETSLDQLQECVQEIRMLLTNYEKVIGKTIRVYLEGIQITGFIIRVECFIANEGFDAFLKVQEEMQFSILKIIEKKALKLSFLPYQNASTK